MLKRAFDVAVSAILLGALSPLLLVIALVNLLTSPGPIFYRAMRVGRYGGCLKIYKFRTMIANADKIGPAITTTGDPRVTPLGRILRKTKLDELPQLINVLKGEMSLVGPRPEDPRYVALYTREQREVLRVRPGITSPASVRFRHEEAMLCGQDWDNRYIHEVLPTKLAIDLEYARHASLWLDLVIMFRTFFSLWNVKMDNQTATARSVDSVSPVDTANLPTAPTMPFVSIIMPVRNEADAIKLSLRAVLHQDYPHDRMEVIIADGMSTDGTRQAIDALLRYHPDIPVTVLDNPGKIAPTGLNVAVAWARGDIIIRVDGHCEIARNYASRCVDHLLKRDVDGVGGPIETIGSTPLSQSIAVGMSSTFGVGGSAFRTIQDKAMLVDTVAFPAYKRQAIEKAGPFDEELVRNQDDEYNYRLRELGGKIFLTPDIRSRYHSRSTMRSLWRQYFQYGYWKVRVMQKHPRQVSARQFVPPLFVGTALVGGILAPFSKTIRYLWLTVLVLYGVANLGASLASARKRGWRHLVFLPAVFATLHVSYGLGFLNGLRKFALRLSGGETRR